MRKILLFLWLLVGTGARAAPDAQIYRLVFSNRWGEERLILLTGFGPFGGVLDNPSGRIVFPLKSYIDTNCPVGEGFVEAKKLPVRPGIIEAYEPKRYQTVISMGVDTSTKNLRLETAARNRYDNPATGQPEKIDPSLKLGEVVRGPAYPTGIPDVLEGFTVERGTVFSAGTFVCNDTYFRLCRTEGIAGYFVHIPNVAHAEDLRLSRAMGEIACRIFEAD